MVYAADQSVACDTVEKYIKSVKSEIQCILQSLCPALTVVVYSFCASISLCHINLLIATLI